MLNAIKNKPIQKAYNKKKLLAIINDCLDFYPKEIIITLLDDIKELGFHFSTISGITISAFDLFYDTDKQTIFNEANQQIEKIRDLFRLGGLTSQEKRAFKIKT